MPTGYKRNSRGQFNGGYGRGALGGKYATKSSARPPSAAKTSGAKATSSSARPPAKGKARSRGRSLSQKNKNRLVGAAVVVGVGAAGHVAVTRAMPGQTFATSKKSLSGTQEVLTGGGAKISRVVDGKLQYVTQTARTGRGLTAKIETTTLIGRGDNTIGMIHSTRRPIIGRSNIIQTSYLTQQNRKKGIGGSALIAHAAHEPNRRHRASLTRSAQGQAFAKSFGGAGARSRESKKKGAQLTSEMNAQWKANKTDYNGVYRALKSSVEGGTVTKTNLASLKRGKRLR